ncbi:NAD(P)H-binding protein [Labrys miyagiensis]|uniref:NAD(P)H-binding protein n=1 Tax=Labrys miyagiensis TaxID=346912 RepID=UPI003D667E90
MAPIPIAHSVIAAVESHRSIFRRRLIVSSPITGATGTVSTGIIEQLKGSDHKLRALVRYPEKAAARKNQSIEVHQGDLEKPWTLDEAFAGVDTVWILSLAGARAPEQSSNALWAAPGGCHACGAYVGYRCRARCTNHQQPPSRTVGRRTRSFWNCLHSFEAAFL